MTARDKAAADPRAHAAEPQDPDAALLALADAAAGADARHTAYNLRFNRLEAAKLARHGRLDVEGDPDLEAALAAAERAQEVADAEYRVALEQLTAMRARTLDGVLVKLRAAIALGADGDDLVERRLTASALRDLEQASSEREQLGRPSSAMALLWAAWAEAVEAEQRLADQVDAAGDEARRAELERRHRQVHDRLTEAKLAIARARPATLADVLAQLALARVLVALGGTWVGQMDRHAVENAMAALAEITGIEAPATPEAFAEWGAAAGGER
jgi:hypothetical protein